ncbi:MAG: PAS domain-containing protein, partial [Rhodospirillales bacterium]|nr:PAS domain-containing protein [Rhodospirillales bacterium]
MLTDDKVDGTAFIEGALLGAFHVSWNGDRLWANAAFAEALHYPDAQALAAAGTFWNLFAFSEEAEGLRRRLVEDGALRGWEAHLLGGDGMVQQFNLHVRRLQESDGVFLEGMAENISRRKLMEDVDEQATSKFKSIFDNAIEGMYQATPGGEFISINPALARSLGYDDPSALLWGGTIADHFADSDVGARFWRQLLEDGEVREFEATARHTDGAVVWLKHHARCLRNPQGEIAYCEGMVEDITRRKMVE